MPNISTFSNTSSNPNRIVIQNQECTLAQHGSESNRTQTHMSDNQASNPRLEALSLQLSNKQKRKAVKEIMADFERLQDAGISGNDAASIAASQSVYVKRLTDTKTRLAQFTASGLTEAAPPISFSRSAKNGLSLTAGGASKVVQVGVAGAAVIAGGAAVACTTSVATLWSGLAIGLIPCIAVDSCTSRGGGGFQETANFFGWVYKGPPTFLYKAFKKSYSTGMIGRIDQLPRTWAYASRPRVSTAAIASTAAEQISAELLQLNSLP